jgi:F-type H+-transporting ATPase subunit delta
MQDLKVAGRYAKSLFDLAIEKNVIDAVAADFKLLNAIMRENRPLMSMIKSPVVPADLKNKIMRELFASSFDSVTMSYLDLIIRKRRESHLPEISFLIEDHYNDFKGILKAKMTLADEVGTSFSDNLKDKLATATGKKIELTVETNKDLVGGFVLRLGDKQIDTSLRTRLKNVQTQLLKKAN